MTAGGVGVLRWRTRRSLLWLRMGARAGKAVEGEGGRGEQEGEAWCGRQVAKKRGQHRLTQPEFGAVVAVWKANLLHCFNAARAPLGPRPKALARGSVMGLRPPCLPLVRKSSEESAQRCPGDWPYQPQHLALTGLSSRAVHAAGLLGCWAVAAACRSDDSAARNRAAAHAEQCPPTHLASSLLARQCQCQCSSVSWLHRCSI